MASSSRRPGRLKPNVAVRPSEPEPAALDIGGLLATMGIDDADAASPEALVVDGLAMPAELAQLRQLLETRAKYRADMAALDLSERGRLELKLSLVDDCVSCFGASLRFLHDLVLDHECLLAKLRAAQRLASAFPRGFQRYDESVDAAEPGDEELFSGEEGVSDAPLAARADPGDPSVVPRRRTAPGPDPAGEDYEALDQRRQASFAQLRACLRSCGVVPAPAQGRGQRPASSAGVRGAVCAARAAASAMSGGADRRAEAIGGGAGRGEPPASNRPQAAPRTSRLRHRLELGMRRSTAVASRPDGPGSLRSVE